MSYVSFDCDDFVSTNEKKIKALTCMTTSTSGCCDLSGRHGRGVKNKQLHAIRLYDQALPLEALCDCVKKKIEKAVLAQRADAGSYTHKRMHRNIMLSTWLGKRHRRR